MTGKLTAKGVESLAKRKGRYGDEHGLFLRVLDPGHKVYWTYRFRLNGADREMSVGAYPELLNEARRKHAALRAQVLDKIDPLGQKRAKAKTSKSVAPSTGTPTFGACAEAHVETHEGSWRSSKHRRQWHMTLHAYCKPIWSTPVNEVDTAAVLSVLKPLWARAPETGSRLRGRIEVVLSAAQVDGWMPED